MASETKSVDLSSGNPLKLLIKLALPAIVAQVINVLYNVVDRAYIGHIEGIGTLALTGVGVCMPFIMCISAFAALVSFGSAPRASIELGRGRKEMAQRILGNSTMVLFVLGLVLTIFILFFGRDILLLIGADGSTIGYAWEYMRIYALGTVFVQGALGLNAFINAQGYATTGMLSVLIGALANIILDPIFIFLFDMGVAGAAWATIISQAMSCIFIIVFLSSKRSYVRLQHRFFGFDPSVMLPCIALGLSPFVMQFTEAAINICFNRQLLTYGGTMAVGAMTILSSVMQFSMLPLQGMTQGSQPIVSFNLGAGRVDRIKANFKWLLILCVGYSMLIWAISVFAPQLFVMLFSNDPTMMAYGCKVLRIYMAISGIFGIQIACQQTFVAMGNAKTSLFLAVLRKVFLLIPLIYIMPMVLPDMPDIAVFMAEPVCDLIAVTVTGILFARTYRRLDEIVANAQKEKMA